MNYPTMTATVERPSADEVNITIGHDIAQSFSKAVDPRAMREARKVLRDGRTWRLVDADYGIDTEARRTNSRFVYIADARKVAR